MAGAPPVLAADLPEAVTDYPELADDISTVDQVVTPAFRDADLSALRHQNRYRRRQVVIIVGSALLTGLGGLQAVFPAERWPGLLLALLGALLAVLSNAVNELSALENFMTERVKAERLRWPASGSCRGPDATRARTG